MKKVLSIMIVAALAAASVFSLAACSASNNTAATENTTAATAAATQASETQKATDAAQDTQAAVSSQPAQQNENNGNSNNSSDSGSNEQSSDGVYQKILELFSMTDATGYNVAKLEGSDYYFLILAHGESEAERYYELYRINVDELQYVGNLEGSHTTAYIGYNSCLGLYYGHMGNYSYGTVSVNGGLHIETEAEGYVDNGQEYPDVPGEAISFFSLSDYSGIAIFN